jgi:CheY-like chemotaxis protein
MNGDKPYKVMIVDDDKFLLNMYPIKFTNNKFDVTLAGDGQAAVTKLKDGYEPDIILLDVVMPVMDGIEALNIIRKEGLAKSAAIMMLSNQGQPSDIEKAKAYNVDGYIVKATSIPSEIITEVLNLLERTKSRRESAAASKTTPTNAV